MDLVKALKDDPGESPYWGGQLPQAGEICTVCPFYQGKRAALLFDRFWVAPNGPISVAAQCLGLPPEEYIFGTQRDDLAANEAVSRKFLRNGEKYPIWIEEPNEIKIQKIRVDTIVERYRQKGFSVTPSYPAWGALAFQEESAQSLTDGSEMGLAHVACLASIPVLEDREVSWKQILEFRSDAESLRKYRDLRLWLRDGLKATSVQHAVEIVEKKLDDYRWAIRKHGLETKLSSISQILEVRGLVSASIGAVAAGTLSEPLWGALTAGLMLAGRASLFVAEQRLKLDELKRSAAGNEVAVLYDAAERFGQPT